MKRAVDVLILSNGPGELATWVKPVVRSLRQRFGDDRSQMRISVVLSPCTNASGQEASIAHHYPEVDRVQAAEHFFPFLLWGKTADAWEWRSQGLVLFLGGDQFFPVVIGKRLGYRTIVYAEWEARWQRWIDRFGVMHANLAARAPQKYAHKFTVVGDLMAEVTLKDEYTNDSLLPLPSAPSSPLIGLLPGSKPVKLTLGVPLCLSIAEHIRATVPTARFVIAVAPTLDVSVLSQFADPTHNAAIAQLGWSGAELVLPEPSAFHLPFLKTASGLKVELWTEAPAHDLLSHCCLCLTTVGANTAELGALAVPMLVLMPLQQIAKIRVWDGLPGLLSNLPGIGGGVATLMARLALRQRGQLAWPNIWAKREIVPELAGKLQPEAIAALVVEYLDHPEMLEQMRDRLRNVRGQTGAAEKLVQLVAEELEIEE